MKQYQVVIYQESGLSSILFGAAKVNPVKFSQLLNEHARNGWRVVSTERENRRLFLFFRREAYIVIMEKEND